MTLRTAIAALEAITADNLKEADTATLDRLEELIEDCELLLTDEHERRNPSPTLSTDKTMREILERGKERRAQRMAEQRAQQEERRATMREAIAHCATNPDLHTRLQALFPIEDSEL
jgi:hypothetical protein